MFDWAILQLFLYFPEDKSEYIPASISMAIFLVITVLAFRWIIRISKKQEEATREMEEEVTRRRREEKKSFPGT